jgi:hypothetical protein
LIIITETEKLVGHRSCHLGWSVLVY